MVAKATYVCDQCGAESRQWAGQCGQCGAWNSLEQRVAAASTPGARGRLSGRVQSAATRGGGYAGTTGVPVITAASTVTAEHAERWDTSCPELNRVLGGGLVKGSAILLGGDPGVGKSTLLLQTLSHMAKDRKVLYVSGEESLAQMALRIRQANMPEDRLWLLSETACDAMVERMLEHQPDVVVVDSIQTVYQPSIASAPGSVSQVRECAMQLVQYAKRTGTALWMIGHVTKEGHIAGPRVLEHMVDVVLYFEGANDSRFRMVRGVKNRFGATNELGIFAMHDGGLKAVTNPSSMFLRRASQPTPGSVVTVLWEGSRPLLIELQALVDTCRGGQPRRLAVGMDPQRLAMILAILSRHAGLALADQDIFVNVVGGLRLRETASDLAVAWAIHSSLTSQPVPYHHVVFGELGLSGEVRPVPHGEARLNEAAKQGLQQATLPQANVPKRGVSGLALQGIQHVRALVEG